MTTCLECAFERWIFLFTNVELFSVVDFVDKLNYDLFLMGSYMYIKGPSNSNCMYDRKLIDSRCLSNQPSLHSS